jgi:hypothetical protein
MQKAKIWLWLELVYVWWLFSVGCGAARRAGKGEKQLWKV